MASFSISLGGSTYLLIAGVLLLAGLAIIFYRYTLPPLPVKKRLLLSLFRACALSLLLAALWEPVVRMNTTIQRQPVVAVLVDNSQSMTIADAAGSRSKSIVQYLANSRNRSIPGAEVLLIPFSGRLESSGPGVPESLSFRGESTNLSRVLAGLGDSITPKNIQAAIIITDGNVTEGKNPLYSAEQLHIPIFTIGVGDTSEQRDVLIDRISTNAIAYAETRVPVDVGVKSTGFDGDPVEVTLTDGSTVLDRSTITLHGSGNILPVHMTAELATEGVHKLMVSVTPLRGELTEKNNSRFTQVKVLRNKLRILLLAGAPSPDVAALRQLLSEDPNLHLTAAVQKSQGEFYEGPLRDTEIDSADCIVMIGFPSALSSQNMLTSLSRALGEKGKPLLFVAGKSLDWNRLHIFDGVLPFAWTAVPGGEMLVLASIPEREKSNPLIEMDEGTISARDWEQLPPLFRSSSLIRVKPEASVLAMVRLQGVPLTDPLIATRSINRQRSLAITGYGIWRWRLLAQGNAGTDHLLASFLGNSVRWLTTSEDDKNVRVSPIKEMFTTAEAVDLTGQVYDEQLRPVDRADLTVQIVGKPDQARVVLDATGNGRYAGSVTGLPEGDYTYTATATAGGAILGKDNGRFSIGQSNAEFLETRMNQPLLEQLAQSTGGTYWNIAEMPQLNEAIPHRVTLRAQEVTFRSELELRHWYYLAALVILLFAAEWFLRRKIGMM